MSEEETKEEVKEVKPEETGVNEASRKKVNRLSREELDKKISSLNEKGLNGSRYYRHLQARKQELEARG